MCGVCGMRQFVKPKVRSDQRYLGYRYMYLKDLDPLLNFSIQQKQEFDTWNELTKALSSVYASVHLESNGLFYIHPETVDVEKFKKQHSSNRVFIYHFHQIPISNWYVISEYLITLCQCAKKI